MFSMHPLVIVGAGPVGLTLAYALATKHPQQSIVVVEAAAEVAIGATSRSYPLYLSPRSLGQFARLGITLSNERSWKNCGIVRGGRPVALVESTALARGSLIQELLDACCKCPNIRFMFGKPVATVEDRNDGSAGLHLADGTILDAQFVFDTSGCRSVLRVAAEVAGAVQHATPSDPSNYWVKILRFENVPTSTGYDDKYIHSIRNKVFTGRLQKWGATGMVLVVDLYTPPGAPTLTDLTTFDEFAAAVLRGAPELAPYLVREEALPDTVVATEYWLTNYVWGRHVAFLGDAAHATNPVLGQGVNAGLHDVAVFLECWADERVSLADAAVAYSARQVPEGEALVQLSNTLSSMVRKFPFMMVTMSVLRKAFPFWLHELPSSRLYTDDRVTYAEAWHTWHQETTLVKWIGAAGAAAAAGFLVHRLVK
ncbi:Aste57867_13346 [Aphanomyces stellatus]|uniref:Aste57867_13346 protein n=1 Tax=Aphanomyces stellatus TaxID=120398 RepID=A0A485KYL9_9STRA|nr:hypothetical protein As57867_013296 [Aphanomyces stellatus]VFT90185.1 Aste57867_13346 [Aphanomyces stellatus]